MEHRRRIRIELDEPIFAALREIADAERRAPVEQAALFVTRAVARRRSRRPGPAEREAAR